MRDFVHHVGYRKALILTDTIMPQNLAKFAAENGHCVDTELRGRWLCVVDP